MQNTLRSSHSGPISVGSVVGSVVVVTVVVVDVVVLDVVDAVDVVDVVVFDVVDVVSSPVSSFFEPHPRGSAARTSRGAQQR
jgi:hypothetical protein